MSFIGLSLTERLSFLPQINSIIMMVFYKKDIVRLTMF